MHSKPRDAQVCPGVPKMLRGAQGCPEMLNMLRGAQGYSGMPRGAQGCPEMPRVMVPSEAAGLGRDSPRQPQHGQLCLTSI